MNKNRAALEQAIEQGEEENGSVEFKSRLNKDVHLADGRRESLAAQLRHRVLSGDGEATYVIGVTDNGDITGLSPGEFSESMDVLSLLAREVDARVDDVSTWNAGDDGNPRLVGLATLRDGATPISDEDHLIIGTAGHVDHGKSTLVGSLVTGKADNGEGGTRSYLDVQKHEVERGLSADLSYAVYGFADNEPIQMDNPHRSEDRSSVVEEADRLVSFVDTVGHQPWLRTTIRGLVGQRLDYGLLVVAADDGPTKTTREHLGLLIATELPIIVVITKTDMVPEERVEEVERDVEKLLRHVNRTPLLLERHDVDTAVDEITDAVAPIVRTSAVEMEGFEKLNDLFKKLPKREQEPGEFTMYIDKIYNVEGVGPVVSGTIQSGEVQAGDELLVGPLADGSFRTAKARSIEIHYYSVEEARAGQIVSIALSNVDIEELNRGMVLLPNETNPSPTREFEAEVVVLNHPTSITDGYEPVVHLETISETVVIHPTDDNLLAGDKGTAKFQFKFDSYYIKEGQRFVFREGSSKGVGTVSRIID